MRTNLELLKIKPELRFIESTDDEISGMEHIIDSLLFLAKPEKQNKDENINMSEKTLEIIEKYNTHNSIIFIKPKKIIIKAINEELYKRILCNLIENAIKYKSEGDIQVSISKESIIISNPISQNMSTGEIKNITKIFYQ